MVDVLVDLEAFKLERYSLGCPVLYEAALRQIPGVTRYALVPEEELLSAAGARFESRPEVLTTPDREVLWETVRGVTVDWPLWCLQREGLKTATAKSLIARGGERARKSKWGEAYQRAMAMLEVMVGSKWEPKWEKYGEGVSSSLSVTVEAESIPSPALVSAGRHYEVLTADRVREITNQVRGEGMYALDFETEGEIPLGLVPVGFSFSTSPGEAYYVPLRHSGQENVQEGVGWELLRQIVSGPWVAHNAKFEYHVLRNMGFEAMDITDPEDTMVLSWLAGHEHKGLKSLASEVLGEKMTTFEEMVMGRGVSEVPVREVADYACADADMCLRLLSEFKPERNSRVYQSIDRPLIPVLAEMERRGVLVDLEWLAEWERDLGTQQVELVRAIRAYAGEFFNPASPRQVSTYLFDTLSLDPVRFSSLGYSTDSDTLLILRGAHPVVDLLIEYREVTKNLGTYAKTLPVHARKFGDGRVHGEFNGTGTKTGRLSSSNPNLQNQPGVARRAFVADPGHKLIAADYSQIELRVIAHLSGDRPLIDAFERGESPHMATLKEIFGLEDKHTDPKKYTLAKNINFCLPYGSGVENFVQYCRQGGVAITRAETEEFMTRHKEGHPRLYKWLDEVRHQISNRGAIETLQGKRSLYPDYRSPDPTLREAAMRQGVNALVQGTAGYFTKAAMVEWDRELTMPLLLNVHDEIVVEAVDDSEHVEFTGKMLAEVMKSAAQPYLSVPVEVEWTAGNNWKETKG